MVVGWVLDCTWSVCYWMNECQVTRLVVAQLSVPMTQLSVLITDVYVSDTIATVEEIKCIVNDMTISGSDKQTVTQLLVPNTNNCYCQ